MEKREVLSIILSIENVMRSLPSKGEQLENQLVINLPQMEQDSIEINFLLQKQNTKFF